MFTARGIGNDPGQVVVVLMVVLVLVVVLVVVVAFVGIVIPSAALLRGELANPTTAHTTYPPPSVEYLTAKGGLLLWL